MAFWVPVDCAGRYSGTAPQRHPPAHPHRPYCQVCRAARPLLFIPA